ncbi:MAG: homoserine kinase, partial [Planctomycetes bacterium]|nr:homoserine kinase [Planctomycetota bacterium]
MSASDGTARAFAPATVANCAVGFDVLGHALAGHGDTVAATRTQTGTVRIVAITGIDAPLPIDAAANTAGAAALALLPHAAGGTGFDLAITKGIALGSGMGGSAASAVAAAVAVNALLPTPVDLLALYEAAIAGERVASGSAHGDNVAPALLGGLAIASSRGAPVRVPVPDWLHIGLVRPHFALETRVARKALTAPYELREFVEQSEGLAL